MAMDFKKLGIRSLSAAAFVIVLISCLLFSYISFSLFFFVIALWALTEYFKLGKKLGFTPYKKVGYAGAFIIYLVCTQWPLISSFIELPTINPLIMVVLPAIALVMAVFDTGSKPFNNAVFTIGGWMYAVLPFGLLNYLGTDRIDEQIYFEPKIVLGIILLIWSNDTFAYLGGSFFGKNKMIERVSPGKTWEGTAIGVVVTFALSYLLPTVLSIEASRFWVVAGITVPVLATLGDLLESVLKRQAGVKDSGNVMPGHGGILDRFDSLIFVTPFAVLLQVLFQ